MKKSDGLTYVDVYLGGAPMLEIRLVEGLLEFGRVHPQWRFSLRGANFRYSRSWLKTQRLDGVLALIEAKPLERSLKNAGIPLVHLFSMEPGVKDNVGVDDKEIGRAGAQFFLEKGFLKCAFCGVGMSWSVTRFEGFRDCMESADRSCEFVDVPFEDSGQWELSADSENLLRDWLTGLEVGTAVMAAHDVLANRLVDLCVREGIRIPRDIAVLGVGNHKLLCELSPIPISSIDAAVPTVAFQGANMLEKILTGKSRSESILILPKEIVERRSTEIIAYADDIVAKAVAFIRDHVQEGIAVEDLLRALSVSRRTLTRRFSKYVGHSPAAEIRRARFRHAKRLVANTNQSLTEIASNCGYSDLSHMTRAFREIDGVSGGLRRLRKEV